MPSVSPFSKFLGTWQNFGMIFSKIRFPFLQNAFLHKKPPNFDFPCQKLLLSGHQEINVYGFWIFEHFPRNTNERIEGQRPTKLPRVEGWFMRWRSQCQFETTLWRCHPDNTKLFLYIVEMGNHSEDSGGTHDLGVPRMGLFHSSCSIVGPDTDFSASAFVTKRKKNSLWSCRPRRASRCNERGRAKWNTTLETGNGKNFHAAQKDDLSEYLPHVYSTFERRHIRYEWSSTK